METVIRSAVIYLFLLLMFRIAGKRSLAQITTFDFVLLLIISEAVQQAMITNDYSITNAVLVVITLVGLDIFIARLKQRSKLVGKLVDSTPLILIENGKPLRDRMGKVSVDDSDVMAKARELQGIASMDEIEYAILERSGGITIIPKSQK